LLAAAPMRFTDEFVFTKTRGDTLRTQWQREAGARQHYELAEMRSRAQTPTLLGRRRDWGAGPATPITQLYNSPNDRWPPSLSLEASPSTDSLDWRTRLKANHARAPTPETSHLWGVAPPKPSKAVAMAERVAELKMRLQRGTTHTESIAYWGLGVDDLADVLMACNGAPSLHSLHLDGCNVGTNNMMNLLSTLLMHPSCNLAELSLVDNGVSPNQLKTLVHGLRQNRTLRRLNLRHNNLTADNSDFSGLRTLVDCLDGGGDPGISSNNTLMALDMTGANLGDTGILHLTDLIRRSEALVQLDLANNGINLTGGQYLLEALQDAGDITVLCRMDLSNNTIKPMVLKRIGRLLERHVDRFKTMERLARQELKEQACPQVAALLHDKTGGKQVRRVAQSEYKRTARLQLYVASHMIRPWREIGKLHDQLMLANNSS